MTFEKPGPARYHALDAMRGICACLVVLYHVNSTGYIANAPFVRNAWLFVDYFFVLSGFVISASYGQRLREGFPVSRFMFLRLGRIYPLHLFVILIYLLFELAKPLLGSSSLAAGAPFTEPRSLSDLGQALGFLNIFGLREFNGYNPPSWSIAAEFWTYAIMAGLIVALRRTRFLAPIAVAVVSSVLLVTNGDEYLHRTFVFSLPRALLGFALGYALFEIFDRWQHPRFAKSVATVLEIAMIGVIVTYLTLLDDGVWTMLAPFLFLPTIYLFALSRGVPSALLQSRVMQTLGLLSYSIYLTHQFIIARIADIAALAGQRGLPVGGVVDVGGTPVKVLGTPGNPLLADLLSIGAVCAVIAASFVTYYLIENPGRDWSRKFAKKIWPATPTGASRSSGSGSTL